VVVFNAPYGHIIVRVASEYTTTPPTKTADHSFAPWHCLRSVEGSQPDVTRARARQCQQRLLRAGTQS